MSKVLDRRPIVVALAGPNGAGKTTDYRAFLQQSGLRFVNADVLAQELSIGAYAAAELVGEIQTQLVAQRESFIFETVFSDPVGEKLKFLQEAEQSGFTTVLFFIGIESVDASDERVAMRVSQGGHDVPAEKLTARFPRAMRIYSRPWLSYRTCAFTITAILGIRIGWLRCAKTAARSNYMIPFLYGCVHCCPDPVRSSVYTRRIWRKKTNGTIRR